MAWMTAALVASGCVAARPDWQTASPEAEFRAMSLPAKEQLLDEVERAHFNYFVMHADPVTGLVKDRSTPASACSIAAVGFALTAYPVAAKRGWIDRAAAAAYARRVLGFLAKVPQGPQASGVGGYKGFFYHFLDMKTGLRTWNCELSTIDTALLMGGVRFARMYFNAADEADIRDLADQLYNRVEWPWALNGHEVVSMGWTPEKGFITHEWVAYNESFILELQALGHPTHPLPPNSWTPYMRRVQAREHYGQHHVVFGPHFGHQYSHIWVDFRGIKDPVASRLGFDWFENARRATLAQHAYAVANPKGWKDYGPLDWGLTACDGPKNYAARGIDGDPDDGTIAPTAAAASLPYAPELVLPTMAHWKKDRPELWGADGWADAFNPTAGWVDSARLGIDQGPIVLMIENHRSGMIWSLMKNDPSLQRGLKLAGFQ
jgi:hypothetical protein